MPDTCHYLRWCYVLQLTYFFKSTKDWTQCLSLFQNKTNNMCIFCVKFYFIVVTLFCIPYNRTTCKLHVACGSVFIAHSLTKISYVMQTLGEVCIHHITDKHVTTSAWPLHYPVLPGIGGLKYATMGW